MYFVKIKFNYTNDNEKSVYLVNNINFYQHTILVSDVDFRYFEEKIQSIVETANNFFKRGAKAKRNKIKFKTLQTHEWSICLDRKQPISVAFITIHHVSQVIGDLL